MPGCQHLTPHTSACRHLRLCLSFSCPQCHLTHVTYPAPITGQPWGEPTCWRWHKLQLKHQLPPRARMAGWVSPNTFSVSAFGQGRATPCLLQGPQTHSTARFNHLTGPPAPSPVPVPSFSSVLTQARRGRADHPVGRAASITAEAQTAGDASSEQRVIFSLPSGLATKALALLSK